MSTPEAASRSPKRMRLHVLLPKAPEGRSTGDVARALIRGGADVIQLREKSADAAEFLEVARECRQACDAGGAILILNDRVEAVLPSEADGVHLGQEDLDPHEARGHLGEGAIIGVSCHSVEEALRAVDRGADYLSVGCIFPSPTKPHLQPVGPEMIARVAERVALPLVAIGGIRPENVARVIEAGAQAVAVSSAVLQAPDPEAAVRQLLRAIPVP